MRIQRIAIENGLAVTVKKGEKSIRITVANNKGGWAGIKILHTDSLRIVKCKIVFIYRSIRNMSRNFDITIPYCEDFLID